MNATGSAKSLAVCLTKLAALPGRPADTVLLPAALLSSELTTRVVRLLDRRRNTSTARTLGAPMLVAPLLGALALVVASVELVVTSPDVPDHRAPPNRRRRRSASRPIGGDAVSAGYRLPSGAPPLDQPRKVAARGSARSRYRASGRPAPAMYSATRRRARDCTLRGQTSGSKACSSAAARSRSASRVPRICRHDDCRWRPSPARNNRARSRRRQDPITVRPSGVRPRMPG